MSKIYVAYWSGTGNTETMAMLIGKGIVEEGKEVEVVSISSITAQSLSKESVFALGCPSMGSEVLEESEMEDFVTEVEGFVGGKKIALFGSYGWGDGQWMREWEERMSNAGAHIINGEGTIAQESPDSEAEQRCIELGKEIAKQSC